MIRTVGEATLADGTWLITYECGCMVHGVSDYDRSKARRGHQESECRHQPDSGGGTGALGERGE